MTSINAGHAMIGWTDGLTVSEKTWDYNPIIID